MKAKGMSRRRAALLASLPLITRESDSNKRPCGGCTACCEAVGVQELNKPAYTPCSLCTGSGCMIYADRPDSCRSYYCLWQAGMMRDDDNRPDKLGIIFDFRSDGEIDAISAWEVWEGAADQPKVKDLITRMVEQLDGKIAVYIRRYKSNMRIVAGSRAMIEGLKVVELD